RELEAHMKSPLLMIVAAVAAMTFALGVGPARAQTHEDVRIAIERTDELIVRATDIVSGSDIQEAKTELALAVHLQTSAKVEFAANHDLRALDLTRQARLHVEKAIALVNGLPDPDRVLVQLERTRELLDRARERTGDCDLDKARAMLQTAVEM